MCGTVQTPWIDDLSFAYTHRLSFIVWQCFVRKICTRQIVPRAFYDMNLWCVKLLGYKNRIVFDCDKSCCHVKHFHHAYKRKCANNSDTSLPLIPQSGDVGYILCVDGDDDTYIFAFSPFIFEFFRHKKMSYPTSNQFIVLKLLVILFLFRFWCSQDRTLMQRRLWFNFPLLVWFAEIYSHKNYVRKQIDDCLQIKLSIGFRKIHFKDP